MKCTNQHDMGEGAKRCTDCGAAGEGVIAKAVCVCGTEGTTEHKFCANCGETMTKAVQPQDELDKGLEALGLIAKANAELGDELIGKPDGGQDDEDDDEDEDLNEILKSDILKPDANGDVNAMPILDLLLKAINRQATILQGIGREQRRQSKDTGTMAKSQEVVTRSSIAKSRSLEEKLDALAEQFSTWANLPKPRRGQVELINKAIQTGAGEGGPGADDSLSGVHLIAKAVALETGGLLLQNDAGRVQHYANRGVTLKGLAQHDAGLHQRLVGAIANQQRAGQ
jgi:hypothetical protein